ncbi:MAG: hypothetical protein JOZ97_04805, partial [Candidatus Eremiobacteraeota bacterium]|nr:hypothetical protein [Candidatus Eremiobacteraeota bacterium]
CEASGARSIAVVGTAKNVGKTVIVRTLCDALSKRNVQFGVASVGRDGEAIDAVDTLPKPRLRLNANTLFATARDALPASPACEIFEESGTPTALGQLLFCKTRAPAYVELVGPPSASAVRQMKRRLFTLGAVRVVLDGAVDRLAALAGEPDAVIVATGASSAPTIESAAIEVGALVQRLQTPPFDRSAPMVRVDGVLDSAVATALIQSGERRQIVVADPTRITLHANALTKAREQLQIRCERPLLVVAVTVASIGRNGYFEPRAFSQAVAEQTKLPTFDAYAAARDAA